MPLPPHTNQPTASGEDCAICHEPLLVPSADDRKPSYIIDDVELRCKHHFHWSCILEYFESSSDVYRRCPLCRQSVLNSQGEFLVQVRNEGGFIGEIDFGAARIRTFLGLMAQMDFEDAELFLNGEDPDANGSKMDPNVCYETGRMTAIHMAALNDDVEGVQLLLKYGADKDFKSEDGQTALDMARQLNAKNVVTLLAAQ